MGTAPCSINSWSKSERAPPRGLTILTQEHPLHKKETNEWLLSICSVSGTLLRHADKGHLSRAGVFAKQDVQASLWGSGTDAPKKSPTAWSGVERLAARSRLVPPVSSLWSPCMGLGGSAELQGDHRLWGPGPVLHVLALPLAALLCDLRQAMPPRRSRVSDSARRWGSRKGSGPSRVLPCISVLLCVFLSSLPGC